MPFRIFWSPGKPWSWFRNEPTKLAEYVERAGGVDCYCTLNVWAKPEQGTTCNYDFGFDFDSADIKESANDANAVAEYLTAVACPYRMYFSGSKGIHIVVPHEVLGIDPRLDGGHVCKLFQRALKETLVLKTLDTEIHGTSRQWRVPNTINSKSGLYKIPLSPTGLNVLITDGLAAARDLAAAPVPDVAPPQPAVCTALQDRLKPFCDMADEQNRKRDELQKKRLGTTLKTVPFASNKS